MLSKKHKNLLGSLLFWLAGAMAPAAVWAVTPADDGPVNPTIQFSPNIGFSSIQDAFSAAVRWGIFFAILVAGLYLVYAGFRYVTAGDDAGQAEKARTMIANAVIGVIIVASVWLLLKIMTMVIPGLSTILIL